MKRIFFTLLTSIFLLISNNNFAKTIRYNLDIDYKIINVTGEPVKAMAVGGTIPAPTIAAKLGDVLLVTFNNKMDVETSIHWHGVLLENSQDGVPYLTTMPIKPHSSFTYSFPIKHSGTYWYHSHTGLQEQRGIYGALVFYPKKESRQYSKDLTVVLSDWTNENPQQVLANLKKDGDYYALKKDSVQSWAEVIKHNAVKNRLQQSWVRMGAMDLGDIGYDAFLSGGKN
jgi:FtsP/CotA-like multicopper oxidase with cupredoxin domain